MGTVFYKLSITAVKLNHGNHGNADNFSSITTVAAVMGTKHCVRGGKGVISCFLAAIES